MVMILFAILLAGALAACERMEQGSGLAARPARESGAPSEPVSAPEARPRGLDARLMAHVDSLAAAGGHRSRVVFTPGNAWAVDYLRRTMLRETRDVRLDTFRVLRRGLGARAPLVNVIARVPGRSDSVLLLCAHLDASASRDPGWKRDWHTMRAPGADDDASGLAALLEVLGLAAHAAGPPRYTLLFVATQAEEMNPDYAGHHLGSRRMASELVEGKVPVKGVIALDMIAGNGSEPYLPIFAGSRSRWLAGELRDLNDYLGTGLIIPDRFEPCSRSDNDSFERVGLPTVLLMESPSPWKRAGRAPRNIAYHSSRDLPSALNAAMLGGATRLIAAYVLR